MRFRVLVVVPLAGAAAFLIGDCILFGEPGYDAFIRIEVELVKGMALIGNLAAALKFGRGEYLRRAWLFTGGCMFILLLRDLSLLLPFESLPFRLEYLRGGLSVAANLSAVIGTILLARAWRVAGLELPGSKWGQRLVLAVAMALALIFAGPTVVVGLRAVWNGEPDKIWAVASGLGDIISFCLIAPLLLTAIALKGGLLGWPWALFTSSLIAWLCYDGIVGVAPALGADPPMVRTIGELFRCLACLFSFSAGLAQRFVVEQIRKAPAAPK